jgi:excisionase family DNA binding protein
MPYRFLDREEAATYLNLNRGELEQLIAGRDIPFETRGDRTVFRRQDLDDWASQRILNSTVKRLAAYHTKGAEQDDTASGDTLMPTLASLAQVHAGLKSKTKASVIRDMVRFAARTNWICDPADLVESLEAREELCPTALPGGVAFLHPRTRQPYQFEVSFLALGRTVQPIHFSAADGQPTDLFFLLCVDDDRLHLRTLARLCFMAQKTGLLADLRAAPDAAAMFEALLASEQLVLAG